MTARISKHLGRVTRIPRHGFKFLFTPQAKPACILLLVTAKDPRWRETRGNGLQTYGWQISPRTYYYDLFICAHMEAVAAPLPPPPSLSFHFASPGKTSLQIKHKHASRISSCALLIFKPLVIWLANKTTFVNETLWRPTCAAKNAQPKIKCTRTYTRSWGYSIGWEPTLSLQDALWSENNNVFFFFPIWSSFCVPHHRRDTVTTRLREHAGRDHRSVNLNK